MTEGKSMVTWGPEQGPDSQEGGLQGSKRTLWGQVDTSPVSTVMTASQIHTSEPNRSYTLNTGDLLHASIIFQ